MPQNFSSRRVAEKCGMKFEGVLKDRILAKGKYCDIEIHAITKSQYINKKLEYNYWKLNINEA